MDRFLPTAQADLQPSAVLDGNEPQARYASYDINQQKRFWKGLCLVCAKPRHGAWRQCGRQCFHCNHSKSITGPNTHQGQPCPNTGFHPQWWQDMGGANVGETNSDKQRIQAKDNLIRSQQDQINRLEDHVQKRNAYIELLEAEQQRQTARTEQLQQSVRRERGLRASMEAELQEEKAHNEQQQQRLRREAGLRATAEDDAQHLFDKYNDKKDQLRELARYTRRLEDKVNKMESRRERSRSTPDRRSAGIYESREDHKRHRSRSRHHNRARSRSRSRHRSRARRHNSCSRHRSRSSSRPYEALNHNTMESHVFSPGPSDDRLLKWVETHALGAPPHMSPTQPPMHAAEDTHGSIPTGSINYDQPERSPDSPEDGVQLTGHVDFMSTRNNAPGARGG